MVWHIKCPIHGVYLSHANEATLQAEFVTLMTGPGHQWTLTDAQNYFKNNCYQ